MTLRIATDLELPDEFAGDTSAIVARKGAGKTYTAAVIVEEDVAAGIPCVVLDPMGAFWGLRSSADGKQQGLPVTILGGEHGDVPLERTGGRLVADLVVDQPSWYVLDLSSFDSNAAQDQFATDFAERIYRRKAPRDQHTMLHLVIDEADSFAPQRVGKGIGPRMLGAFEAIARRGRIRGLGSTFITQRPAVLNKNVLTQAEVLITLQITSPQDRAAVKEWASGHADKEQLDIYLAALATLQRGEAWVWSPSMLGIFRPVTIRRRTTFDSSSTPKAGEKVDVPQRLADVDVDQLRAAMADTIEKADATDPAKLQKRIRALEGELRTSRSAKPEVERVVETIEIPIVTDGAIASIRQMLDAMDTTLGVLQDVEGHVRTLLDQVVAASQSAGVGKTHAPLPPASRPSTPAPAPTAPRARTVPQLRPDGEPTNITGGALRMLEALATYPNGLTEAQTATLAKLKRSGGTFGTYVSRLRTAGFATKTGNQLQITDAGLDFVGGARPPVDPAELRAHWRSTLTGGARRMYDLLVDRYPNAYSLDELAVDAGITQTGGTFGTYLSRLRSNGLLGDTERGFARAHPDLFMEA